MYELQKTSLKTYMWKKMYYIGKVGGGGGGGGVRQGSKKKK